MAELPLFEPNSNDVDCKYPPLSDHRRLFVNIILGIIVVLYILTGFDDMFGLGILFVVSNFVVVISILIYYDSHLEMHCIDCDKAIITILLGFFLFVSTILDIVSLIYFRESIIAANKEAFNYIMFGVCVTYTIIKPTVFIALKLNRYSNTFWDEFMNIFAELPVLSVLLFINGLLYSLSLLSVSMEFGLLFYISNILFIVVQWYLIHKGKTVNEMHERILMLTVMLTIIIDVISISLYSPFLSSFQIVLGSLLFTLKVTHLFVYWHLFRKWNKEKSKGLLHNIEPEIIIEAPIIEDTEVISESATIENPTKEEIKESYLKTDSDGWKSLKMRCPVPECIAKHDKVYYWEHHGDNISEATQELPDEYPVQINKYGQMRCGGCKGSTVKDYSEYIWEGCDTHSGAKKGKDGYLMKFIREKNYFVY
mmetsp:Transcript_13428/g.16586  ORF Transcript_13428/g.16586 Transcript_13428/m.16586 type:complete len:424 (+) Transcript_13428:71-1342(+)